jgi:hypothetical protein
MLLNNWRRIHRIRSAVSKNSIIRYGLKATSPYMRAFVSHRIGFQACY